MCWVHWWDLRSACAQRHGGAYLQGITPMICDKVLNCFPHTALMATRALEAGRSGASGRKKGRGTEIVSEQDGRRVTGRRWEVETEEDRQMDGQGGEKWAVAEGTDCECEMAEAEWEKEGNKEHIVSAGR